MEDKKQKKRVKLYALILITGGVLGLVMAGVVKYQKKLEHNRRMNELQSTSQVTNN